MGRAEPRLVLGTAGHIDHGKTSLVRALTGIDTDRLPEEKSRGITIDLGFAPLDLPDGSRLGVVDVPGHEGLVRTMVAGASGIDLLLLVVAADEGVMPQTREHLAICELLGLSRAVVALTKADTVEEDMAELAAEEVRELLAETALADAPIVPVSSTTGQGIDALRDALALLAHAAPARTSRDGPPRLSVDRIFEKRGFGSVVTGTLVGGPLAVGDAVELYPSGVSARIRGLQSHGESCDVAEPGVRCAVNLQGVSKAEVSRGQVVAPPGRLAPTQTLDVEIGWLEVAPAIDGPTSVEFLAGTAERRARVAPIGSDGVLEPGSQGFARIHIDGDPVAMLPGERFVLRGFARTEMGGATLGGGRVLDVAPPHRRRSDPALSRELAQLAESDPASELTLRVERAGLAGVARDALERETGLAGEAFDAALAQVRDRVVLAGAGHLVAARALESLEARMLESLAAYHAAEPLRPGMPTGALRGALPENVPDAAREAALERLAERGAIGIHGDHVAASDHRVVLDDEAQALTSQLAARLAETALEAPSLRDLADHVGRDADTLGDLLAHLEREGRIVRAPGDLWFDAAAVEALRDRVRAHFASNDSLDTKAFKELIGTSRRTAVPLMEMLDAEGFTARRGEIRVLRDRG